MLTIDQLTDCLFKTIELPFWTRDPYTAIFLRHHAVAKPCSRGRHVAYNDLYESFAPFHRQTNPELTTSIMTTNCHVYLPIWCGRCLRLSRGHLHALDIWYVHLNGAAILRKWYEQRCVEMHLHQSCSYQLKGLQLHNRNRGYAQGSWDYQHRQIVYELVWACCKQVYEI